MSKRARARRRPGDGAKEPAAAEPRRQAAQPAPQAGSLTSHGVQRAWWWLAAALLGAAAVYGTALGHPFQFDALWKVMDNPELRTADHYFKELGEGVSSEKTTRLIPNLTLVLDYQLWEYDPFGYQLTQLILHLLNVVLVAVFGFGLGRACGEAGRAPALLGAVLFAIHPLNSEAVNYVNARPNVVVTTFYLATLCCVLAALRASTRAARAWRIAGAALSLLGALFSKEMAFSIVVMVPALLWWLWPSAPVELQARATRLRGLAFGAFGAGLVALFLTGAMDGIGGILFGAGTAIAGHWSLYMLVTALDQSVIFLRYAGLALAPLPSLLNADRAPMGHLYSRVFEEGTWREDAAGELLGPAVAASVLLAALVWIVRARTRLPYASFLCLWPFITHGPTSLMPRGEPMVEYRTYLPMAGVCLLLGWGLCRVASAVVARRPGLVGLRLPAALVLWAALAGMTTVRNQAWLTPESLWRDSLEKLPNNARAHNALGNAAAERGDLDEAEVEFRRAIEIDPTYGEGHGNLGSVLAQRGDVDGAIDALKLGVTHNPDNPDVHNNLANILAQRGQYADAIVEYQLAIEKRPLFAEAYGNMALAYALQGEHAMAVAQVEQAIDLNPKLWRLHLLRGNSLLQLGRTPEAVESYRRAVALAPDEATAQRQLGKALAYMGDRAAALPVLERALALDPSDATTRAYLDELRGPP